MKKLFKVIIAGGKTGGHLFPGIAVAQALENINKKENLFKDISILFVGTNAPFETQTLAKFGFTHKSISSKPIKGGNLITKLISISVLLLSLAQSVYIMKSYRPDFVLGVGGFSSFAVVLAARGLGIPTAIQEQNAFPGLTNRLLAKFTTTIFTSFKETKGFESNPKVKYTGNPVRRIKPMDSPGNIKPENIKPDNIKPDNIKSDNIKSGIQSLENLNAKYLNLDYFDENKATILVTGGSQGATSINNAFTDALALMNNTQNYNIIHQTGINDEAYIQAKYKDLKIQATVRAFFHNMPRLLDTADLAIARAGAGTIFELCHFGLPAILVPFPHAADDHQTFNAKALMENGAAILISDHELTGKILKDTMDNLMGNKKKHGQMVKMIQSLAMPNADEKIASYILGT